jgi:hypothetical protein
VLVLKIESQHYISNMWKQGPKMINYYFWRNHVLKTNPCVVQCPRWKNNAIILWPLD